MIAKLAYLTTPASNVFMLNIQLDDAAETYIKIEISKAHLVNILIDGAALAFREQCPHRVPLTQTDAEPHDREHRA